MAMQSYKNLIVWQKSIVLVMNEAVAGDANAARDRRDLGYLGKTEKDRLLEDSTEVDRMLNISSLEN